MSTSNSDDLTAAAVADDLVVDRSCISCDNCGVSSPQKCCGRCGSYYYCRYVFCVYGIYSCGMLCVLPM